MSLAGGQSNPSLSSDEQHNVEVQDEIESVCALTKNTEQESEAQ
jgi:hypothetical protein